MNKDLANISIFNNAWALKFVLYLTEIAKKPKFLRKQVKDVKLLEGELQELEKSLQRDWVLYRLNQSLFILTIYVVRFFDEVIYRLV